MNEEIVRVLLIITSLALWVFYCYFEGTREAYYYHLAALSLDNINQKFNLHFLYSIQRLLVLILVFFACGAGYFALIQSSALAFMFPYLHDGFYYRKRNDLIPTLYIKRFRANSTTSTAKFEIKYKERLLMFTFGVSLSIVVIILAVLKLFPL